MTSTLPKAELAGIVVHSTLYGIYLLLHVGSLYFFLAMRRERRSMNNFLFFAGILLFLSISAQWILHISRIFDAFINHQSSRERLERYLGSVRQAKFVAKSALYIMQMSLGDLTMVYRLYIVWGRNWRVILVPVITTIALTVAGVCLVVSFARQGPGVGVFTNTSERWIVTCFAATLLTNVLVTTLISLRISSVNQRLHEVNRHNIRPIVLIIVESACIYTVCLIITHIGYLAKSPFQFIALDATSPAIGISYTLIIVRVGLCRSAAERTPTGNTQLIDINMDRQPDGCGISVDNVNATEHMSNANTRPQKLSTVASSSILERGQLEEMCK